MKRRLPVLVVLLLLAVTALVPLAYATPPDPTWIGGFWDDADHDDVIVLITSGVGAIEPHLTPDGSAVHAVVTALPSRDEVLTHSRAGSSSPPRAPPAS
jgi:hypothetical protein